MQTQTHTRTHNPSNPTRFALICVLHNGGNKKTATAVIAVHYWCYPMMNEKDGNGLFIYFPCSSILYCSSHSKSLCYTTRFNDSKHRSLFQHVNHSTLSNNNNKKTTRAATPFYFIRGLLHGAYLCVCE